MLKAFKERYNGNPDVTSYDIVKMLALLLMFVDHIGAYTFPHIPELRLIGRWSAPIWLFLIGYSVSRDTPREMWIGNIIVMVSAFSISEQVFPQSILLSIVLIRLGLDRMARAFFSSPYVMFCSLFTLYAFAYPSGILFDYGTLGVLFALCGYACRHRDVLPIGVSYRYVLLGLVAIMYGTYEAAFFRFTVPQGLILLAGMAGITVLFEKFRAVSFSTLTTTLPSVVTRLIQFMGRYTLEIYVVHLVALRIIAGILHGDKQHWFHLKIFPWSTALDFTSLTAGF